MPSCKNTKGVTIFEILLAIGLLAIMTGAFAEFFSQSMKTNKHVQNQLLSQIEAQKVLKTMIWEMRTMNISHIGTHAIKTADADQLTFYSDGDGDSLRERIRYFVENQKLKKGTVVPTQSGGSGPLEYTGGETVKIVAEDLINPSLIFEYYDTNYNGSTAPLSFPVVITDIRLIKVTLEIDNPYAEKQDTLTFTTQTSLRNLKDNL